MYQTYTLADHFCNACIVVLTCGLWLPVYLLSMTSGTYRCTNCGAKV